MMSTSDTASHDPPPPPPDRTSTTSREVEYLDSFPVGYRFMPTDEELLHYLSLRYQKKNLPPNRINEVHLYDHHPEYLTSPGRFKAYEDKEWYFFTPRDRRYRNGVRPKRSAGKGFWKATGADKKILWDEVKKEKLGSKKTLVFYEGKPPKGVKTCWVMHEFKLDQTSIQKNSRADMLLDDSVLCRIHIKIKPKPSDSTTTSSGSRKKKSVQHDHSLSSLVEEVNLDHLQEEEEEDEEEEALSDRGATTDVYNDMEDDHLICSNYDSIMQQYYPTDHHHVLNINNSSCSTTPYSSNIMGAAVSSSSSTAVRGAANIMPLQTCPPTWVNAPGLNDDDYMYTSGTAAPDMGYDQIQQNWGYSDMLMSSLSVSVPDGHVDPPLPDQQWMKSLSSFVPARHPPLPDQQWVSSLSSLVIPAGHPPLPRVFKVPHGYSLPQMPPQMPSQMQQQGYHHHHQYSSSWADGNNNIDGSSSSGINKLHDHAIRRECRERHMVSKENDNNTEHSEYFNAGENLESFDQTSFSKAFNGSSTLRDCGWSRRR